MRNLKYTLHSVAVLAVASLAACSNEDGLEENPSEIQKTVTLTAWQPGSESQTRVGFDSKGKAYWQEGDAIGVIPSSGNTFTSFSIASGAGTGKATFTGKVTGEVGSYAVYPYNAKYRLINNTLYYYLPESYTYDSVDQTFFPEGKDGKSYGMPMLGKITNGNVSFKYLGGVICLLVDKMPAESGTVTVTESTNQLCGRVNVKVTDETPEIKTTTSSSNNSVTFNYSNATEGNPGVFYLPVATGTYNLTVKVEGGDETFTTTLDAVEITRTKLQAVKVVTDKEGPAPVVINGHKFIDLGLPSGLLWAETNIGAETAYDDGNYYAWGETAPKSTYSDATYTTLGKYVYGYGVLYTKYTSTDGKTTLEPEDDAAYVNWGRGCRMPTYDEMSELCNTDNCTWAWVSRTNSAGETINCYKVVSVKNGNIIYLPASGCRHGDGLTDYSSLGQYWSSTLFSVEDSDDVGCARGISDCEARYVGRTVRPVAELLSEGSAKINDAVWNK